MDSAFAIIQKNKASDVKHLYDFEVFETIAQLVHHTAQTYPIFLILKMKLHRRIIKLL
jgi:hypothetical protein